VTKHWSGMIIAEKRQGFAEHVTFHWEFHELSFRSSPRLYVVILHTLNTDIFSLSQCSKPLSSDTSEPTVTSHSVKRLSWNCTYLVVPDMRAILNLSLQLSPTTFSFASSKGFHHLKTVRIFIAWCSRALLSYRWSFFRLFFLDSNKTKNLNVSYEVIHTGAKMLSASVT
jgi:hypothetical protein